MGTWLHLPGWERTSRCQRWRSATLKAKSRGSGNCCNRASDKRLGVVCCCCCCWFFVGLLTCCRSLPPSIRLILLVELLLTNRHYNSCVTVHLLYRSFLIKKK